MVEGGDDVEVVRGVMVEDGDVGKDNLNLPIQLSFVQIQKQSNHFTEHEYDKFTPRADCDSNASHSLAPPKTAIEAIENPFALAGEKNVTLKTDPGGTLTGPIKSSATQSTAMMSSQMGRTSYDGAGRDLNRAVEVIGNPVDHHDVVDDGEEESPDGGQRRRFSPEDRTGGEMADLRDRSEAGEVVDHVLDLGMLCVRLDSNEHHMFDDLPSRHLDRSRGESAA
nr:hypothetical protein CRG98_049676 [Ipomoea batatas]